MPKYKDIKIDVNLSPEMILGEAINKALAVNANEQIKNKTKTETEKESNKTE